MSSQMQRDIANMSAQIAALRAELERVIMQLAALEQRRSPGRPPKAP